MDFNPREIRLLQIALEMRRIQLEKHADPENPWHRSDAVQERAELESLIRRFEVYNEN